MKWSLSGANMRCARDTSHSNLLFGGEDLLSLSVWRGVIDFSFDLNKVLVCCGANIQQSR